MTTLEGLDECGNAICGNCARAASRKDGTISDVRTWDRALSAEEAKAIAKPAQPRLVPVRRGGPWKAGGRDHTWTEVWRDGRYVDGAGRGFVIVDGKWWYARDDGKASRGCIAKHVQPGDELRPKKDWTGEMPEGCCEATDFVVGQRVRVKPASKSFRTDGKVTCVEGDEVRVKWSEDSYECSYGVQFGTTRVEGY